MARRPKAKRILRDAAAGGSSELMVRRPKAVSNHGSGVSI
jgi:hypothetical protein